MPVRAHGAGCMQNAASFSDWYRDIDVGNPPARRSIRFDDISLRLTRTGAPGNYSYVFDGNTDAPYATRGGYFPIDGRGWGNETYWVFINGRRVIDLGGVHEAASASMTLTQNLAERSKADGGLGLQPGRVYEIALFQAERRTTESNFKLTLRGFIKRRSVCASVCGDGIQTRDEQCDLGDELTGPPGANEPPGAVSYGGCSTSCQLGPFCGDGITTSPPETCDDGNRVNGDGCSAACQREGQGGPR